MAIVVVVAGLAVTIIQTNIGVGVHLAIAQSKDPKALRMVLTR